ncbi:hypothetical protein BIW11_12485 [Tropilaelaps mercedesae]|uniref:Glucosidase II beta subunit N-terminal domain-containing protein n=1 Tax=Tropilaelaps mercedesae TaxID=418985 RepID=A0A1V9X657_9ACAR|nr:hypothetical protein BIW11_12485 [Tropilaelaps mercedesae]
MAITKTSFRITRLLQALLVAGLVFIVYQMYYLGQLQRGEAPRRRRPPLPDPPAPSHPGVGVEPHWVHFYWRHGTKYFECGGSRRSGDFVDWSAVNDDYCDCGSGVGVNDEPATGACRETHFVCTQDQMASVPSSRVNDGICDCCDGSDEWDNQRVPEFARISKEQQHHLGVFQTPCDNRC